jgi:stalled ribosome rescue protein Dom34
MHTFYGIWVDHAHAYIIKSNKLAEMEIDEMKSDVESHHHGGVQGDEHLSLSDQRSHDERRNNQMKAFAKELIKRVQNGDEFVIFGPGTAKHELKNEVEKHKALLPKFKGMETTDKLTHPQLKEFMKNYFNLPQN